VDPIRSLDEPDPVQRYTRRAARIRALLTVGALLVLAALVYWGLVR
jgi:hypothetical protein